jgi:hypothetical protein
MARLTVGQRQNAQRLGMTVSAFSRPLSRPRARHTTSKQLDG